ncbi:MAG: hypothetical protein AB7E85_02625 [Pseudobdellovibrionaceae bacterium]
MDQEEDYRPQFHLQRPGVIVSNDVTREDMVIPASVSATGQEQPILLPDNTIVLTTRDETYIKEAMGDPDSATYANVLSYLSSSGGFPLDTLTKVFTSHAQSTMGPMARMDNMPDGTRARLIEVTGHQRETLDPLLYGGVIDRENINIPENFKEAFPSFVTAHELVHTDEPVDGDMSGYVAAGVATAGEFKADREALKQFSPEFGQFIYDVRALTALNSAFSPHPTDTTHSSFIELQTDENGEVADEEYTDVANAPNAIRAATEDMINKLNLTDVDSEIEISPDQARYAALKLGRQLGVYDDIPYGNQFVDRYLEAGERLLKPEVTDPDMTRHIAQAAAVDITNFPVGEEPEDVYVNYDAKVILEQAGFTKMDAEEFLNDPAQQYAMYKTMYDSGGYANLPETTAYLERYMAAAEGIYGQDYLDNVSQDYMRTLIDGDVKAAIQELNPSDETDTDAEILPEEQAPDANAQLRAQAPSAAAVSL